MTPTWTTGPRWAGLDPAGATTSDAVESVPTLQSLHGRPSRDCEGLALSGVRRSEARMARRHDAQDHGDLSLQAPSRRAGMTEAELRARVVELAHAHGWRVFSLPIAKARRPVKDAIGYPDLTLARNKQSIWIELKTEEGTLSKEQFAWMRDLPLMLVVRPSDLDSIATVLR